MSLSEALKKAENDGVLTLVLIKNLKHTCCDKVEQEVYDFDAYKDSLKGDRLSKSCDGVYVAVRKKKERILLLEMKGVADCQLEFHFQKTKFDQREATPEETAKTRAEQYEQFVEKKLEKFELEAKFSQTNALLCNFQSDLLECIEKKEIGESAVLLCNISYKNFLNRRDIITKIVRDALKQAVSPHWGKPKLAVCDMFTDQEYFNSLLA